jgi:hypothetical protein
MIHLIQDVLGQTLRIETFDYMAKYFENSLSELSDRNQGVETTFRRVDGNRFTAVVYRNGQAVSRCTIFMGGAASDGIAYFASETTESNSYNEEITVDADDQFPFFRALGMPMRRGDDTKKLTQEGASEYYWTLLIDNLQGR